MEDKKEMETEGREITEQMRDGEEIGAKVDDENDVNIIRIMKYREEKN